MLIPQVKLKDIEPNRHYTMADASRILYGNPRKAGVVKRLMRGCDPQYIEFVGSKGETPIIKGEGLIAILKKQRGNVVK